MKFPERGQRGGEKPETFLKQENFGPGFVVSMTTIQPSFLGKGMKGSIFEIEGRVGKSYWSNL